MAARYSAIHLERAKPQATKALILIGDRSPIQ
jgi:hypothetical protein